MKQTFGIGVSGALAAVLLLGTPASAQQSKVTLNMASTFPGSMFLLGDAATKLPAKVARVSGGEVEIKFFEPGALVPAAESVNAVSAGSVDAAWAGAGWFAGRDSAFNMFSSVPFGPGIGEYLAWMYHGGGLEAAREMFAKQGVYNVPCSIIPPEASGWFRKEIKSPADFKGIKMRFFGLGAKVMEKLGVATQQLAPGEIFQALQLGTIDATEFSLPAIDEKLGFYQVAKYYYFPGWHQQATLFDVYVNLKKWDAMADKHKAAIEMACADMIREGISLGEATQGKAIQSMKAKGAEIRQWPPEMLAVFEKGWNEVVAEESAKNPNFKKIYDSYTAFRAEYAAWKDVGYLK
ncbi:MAG: TRAP transporter substrate-binding protein [Rhodospirillales bacterium]|jgi:TRAP-type mannitol/chloroaromatic compound transport system substrate-binding protein|nr:TRAP transporter substrate-binding protein [Rhodospirillales bacterium]